MTCKDCIHYEACKAIFTFAFNKKLSDKVIGNAAECDHFKNKADFVEVVRCKDCKCYIPDSELDHNEYPNPLEADGLCENIDKYTDETDFCCYGERSDT
jgi:hypothetical protein